MNFGTRRSDEGFTELGASVMAGLVIAGLVIAGLVIAGLGTWADGVGATVLVVELLEAVGVCNVGAIEGAVAPAQPAKANVSAVAPARDRAAYRRGCLTWTNSNEPTNAEDRCSPYWRVPRPSAYREPLAASSGRFTGT
jgi:hypothetical protein